MPVLISQNLVEKKIIISLSPVQHFITKYFFSHNLSCKLQLIDLVTVSVACLAGWQTILECFSRELWVRRKRKETLKWMENYKRNWTLSSTDTPLTFCQ